MFKYDTIFSFLFLAGCFFVFGCRWLRNKSGAQVLDETDYLPILQFVGIQRSDTKEWAIPGVRHKITK